jgi:hypothetical protein
MSDLRLDGTSSTEQRLQCRSQSAFGPFYQHLGLFHVMVTIAAINNSEAGKLIGQDFHLLQRLRQCVPIVRIARPPGAEVWQADRSSMERTPPIPD